MRTTVMKRPNARKLVGLIPNTPILLVGSEKGSVGEMKWVKGQRRPQRQQIQFVSHCHNN